MTKLTIAIGCDHAGFGLKLPVIAYLEKEEYNILDMGTFSEDSVDYPDFAHPVAIAVESGKADYGILICGSGNGVAITANKHTDIRAALCWNEEIAALARMHNNANIIALPARFVSIEDGVQMVKTFLSTAFEGGRHERRVEKINC
ncbi:MAG TPA: ribose 5-phosphate isomerase B [Saprospiraceae bacterium]|nr:ribose 5-phosphate isomerase B [Saprospiraceae bacterium]MCC6687947.1 ribose 5-phosphate isomerase B [Saprospiraceae bacterium]HMV23181.1 ribose 5-phosphate isomerase B [Saprospiraceae bacterium]HMW75259.1 ribose 5-phosphate isomerase B [Saprospiraceae bacterium]HMX83162.1 ribose 5-phosphate isomerase B [Saprospiraceae bacterium]